MTINIEKSVEVQAPVDQVFAVWLNAAIQPELFPSGVGSQFKLTESVPDKQLTWQITGPEVNSNATVTLEVGQGNQSTKVVFSAHYPAGTGSASTIDVAHQIEAGLEKLALILSIETPEGVIEEFPIATPNASDPAPSVSDRSLQRSLDLATEAWTDSIRKNLQFFSALVWLPFRSIEFLTPSYGRATPNQNEIIDNSN